MVFVDRAMHYVENEGSFLGPIVGTASIVAALNRARAGRQEGVLDKQSFKGARSEQVWMWR